MTSTLAGTTMIMSGGSRGIGLAIAYAKKTRTDHALFVDAFREGTIGGVKATG